MKARNERFEVEIDGVSEEALGRGLAALDAYFRSVDEPPAAAMEAHIERETLPPAEEEEGAEAEGVHEMAFQTTLTQLSESRGDAETRRLAAVWDQAMVAMVKAVGETAHDRPIQRMAYIGVPSATESLTQTHE